MKKIFLFIALFFATLSVFPQKKKPQLIKANIGNPAAYIRQLKLSGKLAENRNLSLDNESNVEKDPGNTFTTFGDVKMQGKSMYETANDRPGLQEQPPPTISALLKINVDIADRGGPDPMIAVGEKSIAVSNTSWIRFYDKTTGDLLLGMSATGLFERYLSRTINGVNNPDFASDFYDIPRDLPYWCSKSAPCDVDTVDEDPVSGANLPCTEITDEGLIQKAYDTRVFYQKEHKRFIIISALRNESSRDNYYYNDPATRDCEQYLIRLVGIAVSLTEDPNDGFHIYRTSENNYRDWPNAVADKDYLVISNKSGDAKSNGHAIVTVYNFQQMKDGVGPSIGGFAIYQDDANNTPPTVVPVTNFLTNYMSEAFFFLQNIGTGSGKAKIWYLKKTANPASIFNNPPSALNFAGEISVSGADFGSGGNMGLVYYSNAIYLVTHQKFEDASFAKKAGYGLNYFKIPVFHKNNNTYEVSQNENEGFVHRIFNQEDYSYLNPSLAVDALKNVAMQFIRVVRSKSSNANPQIRYKVKFLQDADWRSSSLGKQWTAKEDADYLEDKDKLTDYSNMVKDPFKLTLFWYAHKIETPNGSGVFIGRIDLGKY